MGLGWFWFMTYCVWTSLFTDTCRNHTQPLQTRTEIYIILTICCVNKPHLSLPESVWLQMWIKKSSQDHSTRPGLKIQQVLKIKQQNTTQQHIFNSYCLIINNNFHSFAFLPRVRLRDDEMIHEQTRERILCMCVCVINPLSSLYTAVQTVHRCV